MNLISERWIPVRRADGSHERIAPWQLTDCIGDNPILAVASTRPDFDGALTQFLIGLLQTTCTPSEEQWWDWREIPPSKEVLDERFEMLKPAFELGGDDGALFMQERLGNKAKEHPVTYLLIGAATDSALKQNTDHFQKRPRGGECLCQPCAAAALYTLQTFAPSGGGGGDGKFTSLRGGGPLTTLILGDNLWETVWLNVVYGETFSRNTPDHLTFPWLKTGAFITEAAPVKTIHSTAMKPEHVFWGMPRRIQLSFSVNDHNANSPCSVCGELDERVCVGYRDLTGGLTYQEKVGSKKLPSWIHPRHPLSPYNQGEDQRPSAVHPQEGGIGYRHWLGLIENSTNGSAKRMPAAVIEQFRNTGKDAQLWAFGFNMDDAKARCWYDAAMPIFDIENEHKVLLNEYLSGMVRAAHYVSGLVMTAVLRATLLEASKKIEDQHGISVVWKWPRNLLTCLKLSPTEKSDAVEAKVNASGEELSRRIDASLLSGPIAARSQFWADTEADFFLYTKQMRDMVRAHGDTTEALKKWRQTLKETALRVFRDYGRSGDFDVDPRRIALAELDLNRMLNGNRLRQLLLIP